MQHILKRARLEQQALTCLRESPATVLIGARQSGKTTLAGMLARRFRSVEIFDLERAAARRALAAPEIALDALRVLIIIDELQRAPGLFEVLRPLCDRSGKPATFLLLGSASPGLIKGVSESLAGRTLIVRVPGFAIDEVGPRNMNRLWLRGGFPRAYLAPSAGAWMRWTDGFLTAFLERDVPQMGVRVPAETLRRFWTMLAHYHGQIWNASETARSLDAAPQTAHHYLGVLQGTFMIRVLRPWHENMKKRQVKSPKIYFRDSGLFHFIMGIETLNGLRSHPRYGASWEGFALEQTLGVLGDRDAYFWATQRGAELDLLLLRGGKRYGFEFKCSDAPALTRSMHVALEDLGLEALYIIYPGQRRYRLNNKVEAIPLTSLPKIPIRSGGI
jgi:predicted AAA+ superfamily ATPase